MSIPGLSLDGEVALITGGRRGIGKAIALTFAEAGADVVVNDIVAGAELEAVASEIQRLGRRSLTIHADISRKADVDDMVQRVTDEFGAIDTLINDPYGEVNAPLIEFREEDWDMIMDTSLKGYFLCCQAAGKRMADRKKGNIINMASNDIASSALLLASDASRYITGHTLIVDGGGLA